MNEKSITAASCSGVYFFTGFNPGIVNTALFLFTPPPPSDNTSRNRRRAISRMVVTEINGLPQGTPSYKSSSVRRFKNFVNTLLWSTQHTGTCIRAMLIVHPLPAIFTGLFFTESIMDLVYSALPLFVRQLSKLCYLNILLLNLTTIL